MNTVRYLDKLVDTYDFLNRKYDEELCQLQKKIYLEKYYYENSDQLLKIINRILQLEQDQNTLPYSNLSIRGGDYVHMSAQCAFRNAQSVVYFSYVYEDKKYNLYLYDTTPEVYMNNEKIGLEECVAHLPILNLLAVLKMDAKNYRELHENYPIFRWGSPEEYGLD